jgi:ATP-dependent DNA helicase DinG
MIAAIARTLTGDAPRLAVIEAGTGTGKTAAYCIAAIPIARALGKSVVISSATVALQEQVVLRDLPDLRSSTGLDFTFALAKGRGRYLCLKRLDDRLKYTNPAETPLFADLIEPGDNAVHDYQELLNAFAEQRWDGELDSWPVTIDADAWRNVTTDHRGCTNNKCSYFKQCPFFRARNKLEGADVIVANHDLVLADLALGGGVVLPEPEECVYIIDEAHHLPGKTQQHFSTAARLGSTLTWLENVNNVIGTMTQRFGRPAELIDVATRLANHTAQSAAELSALTHSVQELPFEPRDDQLAICRFPLGEVSAEILEAARLALGPARDVCNDIDSAYDLLQEAFQGEVQWERGFEAEDWLPAVGQLKTRAVAIEALLQDYASGDDAGTRARWACRREEDVELVSAPLLPGSLLEESLWSRAYAAISTSATLTAVGRFDRFIERSGVGDECTTLRIPSPFDFPRIATLAVPEMACDPTDFAGHCAEVAQLLPQLLAEDCSGLVLFTSWRQMFAVLEQLDAGFKECLKIQGEGSKQLLLENHHEDVDAGRRSVLFGLASFAEGVDLPDDYCRHVVIAKLPFSVPDDPLDQAMAEWAEHNGRNPFYDISVPDAALKLVQACGRLIRHENDWGRITLLDRRIVTRRYGQDLLRSLPPYRLELAG